MGKTKWLSTFKSDRVRVCVDRWQHGDQFRRADSLTMMDRGWVASTNSTCKKPSTFLQNILSVKFFHGDWLQARLLGINRELKNLIWIGVERFWNWIELGEKELSIRCFCDAVKDILQTVGSIAVQAMVLNDQEKVGQWSCWVNITQQLISRWNWCMGSQLGLSCCCVNGCWLGASRWSRPFAISA